MHKFVIEVTKQAAKWAIYILCIDPVSAHPKSLCFMCSASVLGRISESRLITIFLLAISIVVNNDHFGHAIFRMVLMNRAQLVTSVIRPLGITKSKISHLARYRVIMVIIYGTTLK